jgi:predicted ribosomally synthesized peptide with nif11-like leader
MSVESAKAFVERVRTDPGFRQSLEQAGADARGAMIKTAGYDFTQAEYMSLIAHSDELGEQELEGISGGGEPWWLVSGGGGLFGPS